MDQDSEYLLLNSIHELTKAKSEISQRDLSRAVNISLGMTNVLIRRLSQRGLVAIQKISTRKVSYILTPDGMNELAHRTYGYVKRTMRKVVDYKETILRITRDAGSRGFSRIGLLGTSDIDFIIEYAASTVGLDFVAYSDELSIPGDSFVFVSENWFETCSVGENATAYILTLITGE